MLQQAGDLAAVAAGAAAMMSACRRRRAQRWETRDIMKRLIVLLMMAAATCAHAADNAPRNVGIAQAAGGDASDMMVRGAGRPMARSQAARAADSYNVRDFGARGDGTTDDRAAINAALTAASAAGGGTVYFPAGTYRVAASAGHVAPLSHVTMAGAGRQRSTILIDDSAGGGDGISN
ncbi:MAG TPA: glycosyl hydrolase family 28-related protein, partial [Rhizomicrobium sp.]